MSGVSVVRYLLANNAPIIALVPAARIVFGELVLGNAVLPAIEVRQISGVPRNTLAMTETGVLHSDRVQVTCLAKTWAAKEALMALLLAACPNQRGTVNSVTVDSIIRDIEGPDLSDPATSIYAKSRDFMVRWKTASAVPANALLAEDGTPILAEDGSYILLE